MTIDEKIQILEDNLNEYGVCNITLEEYNYLKDEIYADGCLSGIEVGKADAIEELKSKKAEIIMWLIKRDKDGYGTTNGELLDHIFEVAEQLKNQS